ncbi:hypothetical protein BT96DRAFT_158945 [Gymnopus androsaceus JB14]|uniref:Uncharacterized protein n=1 Tax=Gymnopus androsaceus JB14 TaxID=1447944 RepID=A0A6A4HA59_9AGAR|nr:hypothetical protein BT96DRAFT_158945 [Gymnopus androsaceus JB14]
MYWGHFQALIHRFPTQSTLGKSVGPFRRYGLLIPPLPPKLRSLYLSQFLPEFLDPGLVLNAFFTRSPTLHPRLIPPFRSQDTP